MGWKLAFAGYILLSLAAVFYIPTLIPGKFVVSDSYVFGYNNQVALLLFVFLTAIGAVWALRLGLAFPSTGPADRVHRKTFWICMAAAFGVCLVMYRLTSGLGAFGESAYLINRIELASQGLRPYRDFEYPYAFRSSTSPSS